MAKINDEVTAYFRADTSGLVDGVGRAKKEIGELKKSYGERVNAVKGSILDPFSLASRGVDRLVSSMKLSAVTAGALGAGISIAGDFMNRLRDEAAQAKKELEGIDVATGKLINKNSRTSSVQGGSELISRLTEIREQEKVLRTQASDLNPTGGVGKAMLAGRYWMNYGIHGGAMLSVDRLKNESQQTGLASQGGRIAREIPQALRQQADITKERLGGSSHVADLAELEIAKKKELLELQSNGYANTAENQKAISARYDAQISAAKEAQTLDDRRFVAASRLKGIERMLVTDEMRRVKAGELNLANVKEQLSTSSYLSEEKRRSLQIELLGAERTLEVARAESKVAESQFGLAQRAGALASTNASNAAKQYGLERSSLKALREQLAALKEINTTRSLSLELSIEERENAVRELRQDLNFGKAPNEIMGRIRQEREEEIRRNKFDRRQDKNDGLINADRDISGNITGGIDAITGKFRDVTPGYGRSESGLHTGSLSDPATGADGSPSQVIDHDPGGGLHSGSTPRIFNETSAAAHLRGATGAAEHLAGLRGDPAHDPAARLAKGVIFPDLKKSVASESGRTGVSMAGIAGTIATAKTMASSRTYVEATAKLNAQQLTQQMITNSLIQKLTSRVDTLALQ